MVSRGETLATFSNCPHSWSVDQLPVVSRETRRSPQPLPPIHSQNRTRSWHPLSIQPQGAPQPLATLLRDPGMRSLALHSHHVGLLPAHKAPPQLDIHICDSLPVRRRAHTFWIWGEKHQPQKFSSTV